MLVWWVYFLFWACLRFSTVLCSHVSLLFDVTGSVSKLLCMPVYIWHCFVCQRFAVVLCACVRLFCYKYTFVFQQWCRPMFCYYFVLLFNLFWCASVSVSFLYCSCLHCCKACNASYSIVSNLIWQWDEQFLNSIIFTYCTTAVKTFVSYLFGIALILMTFFGNHTT